jgi:hypothetical protein
MRRVYYRNTAVGLGLLIFVLWAILVPAEGATASPSVAPNIVQSSIRAFNYFATAMFALAVLHTFMASKLTKISHDLEHRHREILLRRSRAAEQAQAASTENVVSFKAELFHFLGEIEVVFGLWIVPLFAGMIWFHGWEESVRYLDGRNFTEPLFVLVIMAIAASRPVMVFAQIVMAWFARIGGNSVGAWWLSILTLGPLLGSFITEPAAMTISALLLSKKFFDRYPSRTFAYGTLGLLFVNISIGGTFTHFAAPPVLMVAGTWGWDMPFMFMHFGWKSAISIAVSNVVFWGVFRKELVRLNQHQPGDGIGGRPRPPVPKRLIVLHIIFLGWTVLTNHYPVLFIGGFLFFLGLTQATSHHQDEISLRGPLLVAFFLAGLVIHGGLQGWWIAPLLGKLDDTPLFFGAVLLTAFNDNAAITYLASLVPNLSDSMKYAVVAGAVAGGGLTVIANAPNPAGVAILRKFFNDSVSPLGLLAGAIIPTAIASAVFLLFR